MEVGNSGREIRRSSILKGTEKTKRWSIWKHQKKPTKTTEGEKAKWNVLWSWCLPKHVFLNEVYINMILNSFLELLVEFLAQTQSWGRDSSKTTNCTPSFWTKYSGWFSIWSNVYIPSSSSGGLKHPRFFFAGKKVRWWLKPVKPTPPQKKFSRHEPRNQEKWCIQIGIARITLRIEGANPSMETKYSAPRLPVFSCWGNVLP